MSQSFTAADVAKHNSATDLYIIVEGDVYDLTKFQDEHPGGKKILTRVAGKDATAQFWKYHNEGILKKYQGKLMVGSLDTKKAAEPAASESSSKSGSKVVEPAAVEVRDIRTDPLDSAGDMVPYADPSWCQNYATPYYNETHAKLRDEVREFVATHVEPFCHDWDEQKNVPPEIYKMMGERGYLSGMMGIAYPEGMKLYPNSAVNIENWDAFHEIIILDELCRTGCGGFVWNVIGGFGIATPPLLYFGSPELVARIAPGIVGGDKRICLAVTEPDGGSDVAALKCEAKLTEDGKHYIVNGEKKWITNGVWADYFTTAVRTSGNTMEGITVLLIERAAGGVSTRRMDCQGVWSSGTTYVTFEDVKVPVENVLGQVDQGFKVIMSNFNHERIGIATQCIRFSRVCYEESVKYAHKRMTFGKRLIDHPVIRLKLANMIRQIEGAQAWLENLVYQSMCIPELEATLKMGGAIAALKAQTTLMLEFCAREASQIFGGLSYSRGGQGGKIESLYRDVRAYAIPGGSEEIMLDLSMRQALRVHKMMGMKL